MSLEILNKVFPKNKRHRYWKAEALSDYTFNMYPVISKSDNAQNLRKGGAIVLTGVSAAIHIETLIPSSSSVYHPQFSCYFLGPYRPQKTSHFWKSEIGIHDILLHFFWASFLQFLFCLSQNVQGGYEFIDCYRISEEVFWANLVSLMGIITIPHVRMKMPFAALLNIKVD